MPTPSPTFALLRIPGDLGSEDGVLAVAVVALVAVIGFADADAVAELIDVVFAVPGS